MREDFDTYEQKTRNIEKSHVGREENVENE